MDDGKMTKKLDGTVYFYLKSEKDTDITEIKYETPGILYTKDKVNFLFFEETNMDDNSKTKCRFEFDIQKIKLRRNGPIILEQNYRLNEITEGYLKTSYGELKTKAETIKYEVSQQTGPSITIQLTYKLFVAEEDTGKHQLRIKFQT